MGQWNFRRALASFHNGRIGRKPSLAGEINGQADQHADAGCADTVMPAVNFPERSGDEWRGDDAAVDKQIINLKRVGTPVVARCVQRADLTGEVSLETTNAGKQTEQRQEERYVEGHQKMSGRHEQGADCDCACAPEHTVGDQSTANRCEINETGVEAENEASACTDSGPR